VDKEHTGKMNKIRSKWEFLLQCRPNIKGIIGNAKLVGGRIGHNGDHEKISHFITTKGIFTYNEATDEFRSKLQIR